MTAFPQELFPCVSLNKPLIEEKLIFPFKLKAEV